MNKTKKPEQLENLLKIIRECVDQGEYIMTRHAIERLHERDISLNDAEYILKNGYHEKKKTIFDDLFGTWKYAIRGKTIEKLDIRIIIAFDEEGMIIVTLMHVGGEVKP